MEVQEESVVHLTPTEAELLALVGAAPDGRLHSRDPALLAKAARRTRYSAWQRLDEAGLVAIKTSLVDTRKSVFVLLPGGRKWLEANGRSSPAAPAADELNKPPGTVQAPQPMTEAPEWRLAPPPAAPAKPDSKGVVYGRLGSSIIVHAFNRGEGLVKALCNPGEFFAAEDASKFKRELAFKGPGNLPCQNCEKVMNGTFKPKLFVPVPKPEAPVAKVDPSEPVPVAQAPLPTSGNCATCGLGGSKGPDGLILHHHVNGGLVARTLRGRGGCKSFRVPRPAPVAQVPVEPKVEAPVEPIVAKPAPVPVLRPSLHDKPPAKPPCADCKRYIVVTVLKGHDGRPLCARCKRLEEQLPVGAAPNDPSAPNEAAELCKDEEPGPVAAPVVAQPALPAPPQEITPMPKQVITEVPTKSKLQRTVESLPPRQLEVLIALAKAQTTTAPVTTGEAETAYRAHSGAGAVKHTQFWKLLNDLDKQGVISKRRSGAGYVGTTQLIEVNDDVRAIIGVPARKAARVATTQPTPKKETPAMSTRRTKNTSKPQAPCSVCHEPYTVNASNKIRKHGLQGKEAASTPCKGSGKPPATQNAESARAIEAKPKPVVHAGLARALEKQAKANGKPAVELTEKAAEKTAKQRLVKAKANPETLLTGKQLKDNIAAKRVVAKVSQSKAPAKILKPLAKKVGARPVPVLRREVMGPDPRTLRESLEDVAPPAVNTVTKFLEKFQVKECEMVYSISGIESRGRGKLMDLLQLCRDLDLKQVPWKLVSVTPVGGR